MKSRWKLLLALCVMTLDRPAHGFFDVYDPYWSAFTYVYDDGDRVYVSAGTEASFVMFWISVNTSLSGPGSGGSNSMSSSDSYVYVNFSVPIGGNYGYYSAYSNHTVMDTDGMGYYTTTQGFDTVQAPPPPSPVISGISPASAIAGTSGSLQISGNFFRPGATLSSSPSGLSVSGNYSSSSTALAGNYVATVPGNYTVYVTQDSGTASTTFVVGDPTPQVTSISPTNFNPGSSTASVIAGTGFGSSPSISVSGSDVTATITSASNTQINVIFTASSYAASGQRTVYVESHGFNGNGFQSVGGTTSQSEGTLQVNPLSSVSQVAKSDGNIVDPLYLSTGDASGRTITTSVTPSSAGFSVTYDVLLLGNPNSSCNASLTIPGGQAVGFINSSLTAGSPGCSGVFLVRARANGYNSTNSSAVVVPPQKLIQMMIGSPAPRFSWTLI